MLKNAIQRILAKLGYELLPLAKQRVFIKNFTNLAKGYEHRFGEFDCSLQTNDSRYLLLARLLGTPPSEAYFILHALAKCKDVEGDVCEFGVAQGETSALIANEIASSDRKLHLFDSFEGLPAPTQEDQLKDDIFSLGTMDAYTGTMSCPSEMVTARLDAVSFPHNRVTIHKGFIEDVLVKNTNLPQAVCFAYVDFDFYQPIKSALEFLDETTSRDSIIIVDDYDFFSSGAKTAVDEFIEEKNTLQNTYVCTIPDKKLGHFAIIKRIQ